MTTHTAKTVGAARYVAVFGAAALSFGAASAHADSMAASGSPKTVVSYADLDLSQAADVQALYSRLRKASQRVCGDYDLRNLRMKPLYDACYRDSLSRAVDSVGHTALEAAFAADERIRVATRASQTATSS